jgi:hypothetical protein
MRAHPLADKKDGRDDDKRAVEAIDDGCQAGAEEVEAIKEKRVREGYSDKSAQNHHSIILSRKGWQERQSQKSAGRDEEKYGQAALEKIEADRMDGTSAHPEKEDGDSPDKTRANRQDFTQVRITLERIEERLHSFQRAAIYSKPPAKGQIDTTGEKHLL